MTNTVNTPDMRAALTEARDWFESQAKAVSKGCGSSYELHDLRMQRDALDAALAAPAPAQAGEYPPLPYPGGNIEQGGGWVAPTPFFTADQMRAFADATCAARGAAQAAPVDAENEIDLLAEAALCERLDACLAAALAAPTPPTRRSP